MIALAFSILFAHAPAALPIAFLDLDVVDDDVHPIDNPSADDVPGVYEAKSNKPDDPAITLVITKKGSAMKGRYAVRPKSEADKPPTAFHALRSVTMTPKGEVTIALDPKQPWAGATTLHGQYVSIDGDARVYEGLLLDAPDKKHRVFFDASRHLGRGEIKVSSKADEKHGGALLDDTDLGTGWIAKGDGKGEWIEITYPKPFTISKLAIANGCQKSGLFEAYNRVQKLMLTFDDMHRETIVIRDGSGEVEFPLDQTLTPKKVKVEISDIYKGKKDQLCISELYFK